MKADKTDFKLVLFNLFDFSRYGFLNLINGRNLGVIFAVGSGVLAAAARECKKHCKTQKHRCDFLHNFSSSKKKFMISGIAAYILYCLRKTILPSSILSIIARDSTLMPSARSSSPPCWKPFSIAQTAPAVLAPD